MILTMMTVSVKAQSSLYPVSIAPMMDYTDRHFRYFMRQISKKTLLYTEMITTPAIKYGNRHKLLDFSPEEHPVSLQLGGDNPTELAECAKIGEDWGYDELNLNVGCPSPRVQNGNFGACLMTQPELVAKIIATMQKAVTIPVTVKHRIGVDNCDSYDDLAKFVRIVSESGCQKFIVHARKAWLQGLSPKENRTIPPLRYNDVYRLKRDFPHLTIEINGGITTLEQVREHLKFVDGVMIGRAACDHPYLFATVDQEFYQDSSQPPSRQEVIQAMLPYIDYWVAQGVKLNSIIRHLLQIFAGEPGTKVWKRYLAENAHLESANSQVIRSALAKISY
jgi:tRNA-dihydrouridine synthase A